MHCLSSTHRIPAHSQVGLLNAEHSPDIMLLAARALTFMADALPASCSVIARHGAVPIFCARLLTIEYIDLAEQSLQARDGRGLLSWKCYRMLNTGTRF